MAEFNIAYKYLYLSEGYYVNSSFDRGGETFMGISRKFNPNNEIWAIIDGMKSKVGFPGSLKTNDNLRHLVKKTYKALYWDKNRLDDFKSQEVANECLDIGVLNGTHTAGVYLQRIINIMNRNQKDFPNLLVDGRVGNITLGRINSFNPNDSLIIAKYLNVLQGNLFINLAEADLSQQNNIRGWSKRVKILT